MKKTKIRIFKYRYYGMLPKHKKPRYWALNSPLNEIIKYWSIDYTYV
jgi:hypothetical protein